MVLPVIVVWELPQTLFLMLVVRDFFCLFVVCLQTVVGVQILPKLFLFYGRNDALSFGFQAVVYMLCQDVVHLHETKTKGEKVTVWTERKQNRLAPCSKATAVSLLREIEVPRRNEAEPTVAFKRTAQRHNLICVCLARRL